jgi:ABC-2 type transport system permease protein
MTVFSRTLWDNRKVFAVWAVATGLLAMMYAGFYPQVSADTMAAVPDSMHGFGFDDTSTAAGYLEGAVFGLLVPLLATFYGAATGARMIAADEETGYLDLLLSYPVSRTRLLLERLAAVACGALLIASTVFVAVLAVRSSAELSSIGIGEFAAQAVHLALLAIFFGALATAVGAVTGRSRAVVFGATAGFGVAAYALNGFAGQLNAEWLRNLTPMHYYIGDSPLVNGLRPGAAVLLAGAAAVTAIGGWRLNHRDLAR